MITSRMKLHFLLLMLILPAFIEASNYKTRSRRSSSSHGSSSAGSSGGGGSSGPIRPYSKKRQTNVYASNKLQEFTDGFGKSFGGILKGLWNGGEQQISIVSGKKVKTSFDSRGWNSHKDYDIFSNTLVYTSVALGMALIIYVFFKKHNDPDCNTAQIRARARERYKENYRNYEVLQYIAANGVHPDRANGNIYTLRL